MATYTIDGVALDDPYGRWKLLAAGTSRRPIPAVHAASVRVAGRDGDLPIVGEDREPTVVSLSLLVRAVTVSGAPGEEDDLERNLEALSALLGTNHRMVDLRYITAASVRQADARFVAGGEPQKIVGADAYMLDVVARIPGVYWRDVSGSTWEGALPGVGQAVTHLAGSTAPVGDALLRVTGPAVSPSIRDDTTGVTVAYAGALAPSERLLVDCGQMRAAVVSSDTWDFGAGSDVTGRVSSTGARSSTRWLRLTPSIVGTDAASRWITVTTSATGADAGSRVEIRARGAYL